jgi:molecular chaperone GrpE
MTAHESRSEAPSFDEARRPAAEATPTDDEAPRDDTPLAKAQAEAAEMKDAWLRARAEIENVRRQGQADVARAHKYAIEKFAEDLLAVKDALEQTLAADRAISVETLKTGAELTLKSLDAAFERAQIREIDPVGQKFDPHRHQAMQAVESDLPPNTVVTVFQKGYLINDRVLRPALVTVAKAPEPRDATPPAG